jgi:hypothetical protein
MLELQVVVLVVVVDLITQRSQGMVMVDLEVRELLGKETLAVLDTQTQVKQIQQVAEELEQ